MNIFCDMDGTLTQYNYQDYDNNLWKIHPEVLCKEPVVTDIPKEVIILTKVTTPEEAILKQEWATKYFPDNLLLTTYEPKYMVVDPTNSILISDYNKELEEWREHGGIPIKMVNNVNSPRDDMQCIFQDNKLIIKEK